MVEEKIELIVDSEDNYLGSSSVYYIHPQRLAMVRTAQEKIFSSVLIKNSEVDYLTSSNFRYIIQKMKINAPIEILIHHPLSVMHSYESKQVEANAKLAGFDQFTIEDKVYVDQKTNQKMHLLSISAIRPEKNPNLRSVEVTTTTKTEVKVGGYNQKSKGKKY